MEYFLVRGVGAFTETFINIMRTPIKRIIRIYDNYIRNNSSAAGSGGTGVL